MPIVSIVGYTNAGKSTLLNTLTHADVIAEDKLFATLDPRSRRLRFPEEREVVITDTVGFVRDLPKDLFAAFRATFEEVADADLILLVVDASDPSHLQQIDTTIELIDELGLDAVPRLVVYNKCDRIAEGAARRLVLGRHDAFAVSALDGSTLRPLIHAIHQRFQHRWATAMPHAASLDTTSGDDRSSLASEADADSGSLGGSASASLAMLDEPALV